MAIDFNKLAIKNAQTTNPLIKETKPSEILQNEGFKIMEKAYMENDYFLKTRADNKSFFITPYPELNELAGDDGIDLGTNLTIGGRPGTGKSLFSLLLAEAAAGALNNNKFVVVYWNWEMTDSQQILRLIAHKTGEDVGQIRRTYGQEDYRKRYLEQTAIIKELPIIFYSAPITPNMIQKKFNIIQDIYKDKHIINVFDHTRLVLGDDNKSSEEQKITALYTVCNIIKKRGCINIILSQLNRKLEEFVAQTGKYRAPLGADLFGADVTEQMSDSTWILHNPSKYKVKEWYKDFNMTEKISTEGLLWVDCVKNRNGKMGTVVLEVDFARSSILPYSRL